jgi:DNA polymerase-3 subunit delta
LLLYHGLKDKGRINTAKMLKINPYFVPEYQKAAKNYPMRKVAQVISHLREADMKSKGVGASNLSHADILKQLLFNIMH